MRADHGGNLRALAAEAGLPAGALLDWSASVNPLGVPPRVQAALVDRLESIVHYPDPDATALRERLAVFHGLPPGSVLVANGETEVIYLAAQAFRPKHALVITPAFSEYAHALRLVECEIKSFPLPESRDFLPEPESVIQALDGSDALILSNPNNPTGSLIPRDDLLKLIDACEKRGILCLLDEAFIDWVEAHSVKEYAATTSRHLLVLRSLTKFYALPGLRVGYAVGPPDRIALLRQWQPTWSVNTLAQVAGVAAIEDGAYRERSLEMLSRTREAFRLALAGVSAIQVFPSAANFLLLKLTAPGWDAPMLHAALLAKGMAVRDASSFEGLGPGYLRVAVRLPEENARLVEGLKALLEGGRS